MEQRAAFEERLRKQQARMEALVGDLLSLSRLEARHADVQEEPISLEAPVREIFSLLEPAASEGGVSLKSEVAPGFVVRADRELLDVALKNLVDNAIRYNREGGEVRVRAREEGGETVIEVEDTGEGIPAAHLDRIFERFYRVDPHRSREKGGTGLGLAIVKHAASQLGGRVTVESQPGRGSTFRIHLPRRAQS
jgi:two-component system phosphate regulon sensor histidine kinase PhoR